MEHMTSEWSHLSNINPGIPGTFLGTSFLRYKKNMVTIDPSHTKLGSWLNTAPMDNTMLAQATHAITNHAPIGEYRLRFKLSNDNLCKCGAPETREHILELCPLYKIRGHMSQIRGELAALFSSLTHTP